MKVLDFIDFKKNFRVLFFMDGMFSSDADMNWLNKRNKTCLMCGKKASNIFGLTFGLI